MPQSPKRLTMIYISSQKYRDADIVDGKVSANDFDVYYIELEDDLRMIVDGHHSHAATVEAGVEPNYIESPCAMSYQQELQHFGLAMFLELHQIDAYWYDINTGRDFF